MGFEDLFNYAITIYGTLFLIKFAADVLRG